MGQRPVIVSEWHHMDANLRSGYSVDSMGSGWYGMNWPQ
jgi:hypothetical protein